MNNQSIPSVQVPGIGSFRYPADPSEEASPLAKEIELLHNTIASTDKVVEELWHKLDGMIVKEPACPANQPSLEQPNLAPVPMLVKVARTKLECLNDSLKRLLRNLQC